MSKHQRINSTDILIFYLKTLQDIYRADLWYNWSIFLQVQAASYLVHNISVDFRYRWYETLREKRPYSELFSPNAGKYGSE